MLFLKQMVAVVKAHKMCVFFLFFLALYRFSLIFSGHLFWLDELHYLNTFTILNDLGAGHLEDAIRGIFNAHGRPAYVFFSLIPAALQLLLEHVNVISIGNPRFFDELFQSGFAPSVFDPFYFTLPSAFNVVITLAISVLFYRILLLLTSNKMVSFTGVVIYSLLVNSNVYIRHLLPYDLSLLFFIYVLYLLLFYENEFESSYSRVVVCGILTAIGFLVYPGNYLFVLFLTGGVVVGSKRKCLTPFVYLVCAAGGLFCVEGVARLAGLSFLANSIKLAGNVLQGSFEEGYVFILKYFTHVEGFIGYVLLSLLVLYFVCIFFRRKGAFRWMMLLVLSGYIFHATMGVVFKKLTIYGRLLHMYIPFIVLAGMLVLDSIKNQNRQKIVCIFILGLSFFSFMRQALIYYKISYPLDMQYAFSQEIAEHKPFRVNEFFDTSPLLTSKKLPVVFVNIGKLDEVPPHFYPFSIPSNLRLFKKRLHPTIYPAYQYEGLKSYERKYLTKRDLYMKIYLDPDHCVSHFY